MPLLDTDRILEKIVAVVFRGKEVTTRYECTTNQGGEASTDCTQEPGGVKIPARDGKVLVIVVEKGLKMPHGSANSSLPSDDVYRTAGNRLLMDPENRPFQVSLCQ